MTGVKELTAALAQWLTDGGVNAVTAWGSEHRARPTAALAAVSLRGLEGGSAGYQDYLGEQFNEKSGAWEELYGKKLELTFGLDLYAATAGEVSAALERMGELLGGGGRSGMTPAGFSAGETVYQSESRRYFCPIQARFQVWAVATAREGETFLDFKIKGENKPCM